MIKDQYQVVFLTARSDKVTVTDSYLYHDNQDTFQREPFVVRFQAKGACELHCFCEPFVTRGLLLISE